MIKKAIFHDSFGSENHSFEPLILFRNQYSQIFPNYCQKITDFGQKWVFHDQKGIYSDENQILTKNAFFDTLVQKIIHSHPNSKSIVPYFSESWDQKMIDLGQKWSFYDQKGIFSDSKPDFGQK